MTRQSPPGGSPDRPPTAPARLVKDAALLGKLTRPADPEPPGSPDPDYDGGAASRSEQSAASKIHGAADCPYGVEAHGFMGEHGSPAAEAAQSPTRSEQAGPTCTNNSPAGLTEHWREWHRGHGCDKDPGPAAQSTQEGAGPREIAFEEAAALCDAKAAAYMEVGNIEAHYACVWCALRIRSWSERSRAQPAAGPPASESPGPLAALLREADRIVGAAVNGLSYGACIQCGAEPGCNIDCTCCMWMADAAKWRAALRESSAERGGVANEK